MCERCAASPPPLAGEARRRRRLWELDNRLHCSIVGTCLTLGDLRRIAARVGISIPRDEEEYAVHGNFVACVAKPGPIARVTHKVLDRKYGSAIRRFDKQRDADAVEALWEHCLEEGDIPGPYWAVMTHPASHEGLIRRVFGHVHMLSHLVGAANRADIKRLRELENERDTLNDGLATAKRRLAESERDTHRLLAQHAAELRDLNSRLLAAQTAEQRLAAAEQRIRHFESGDAYRFLVSSADALKRRASEATERADRADASLVAQRNDITALQHGSEQLKQDLDVARKEIEALEGLLQSNLAGSGAWSRPALHLSGKRIVYVGGRAGLIPHLRALVERANGTFIHHDGGIEETADRLGEAVAQGDAVFCPVDCVSHNACRLAKRLCKQRSKAFVPLRSSGLSSFVSGLTDMAC